MATEKVREMKTADNEEVFDCHAAGAEVSSDS